MTSSQSAIKICPKVICLSVNTHTTSNIRKDFIIRCPNNVFNSPCTADCSLNQLAFPETTIKVINILIRCIHVNEISPAETISALLDRCKFAFHVFHEHLLQSTGRGRVYQRIRMYLTLPLSLLHKLEKGKVSTAQTLVANLTIWRRYFDFISVWELTWACSPFLYSRWFEPFTPTTDGFHLSLKHELLTIRGT